MKNNTTDQANRVETFSFQRDGGGKSTKRSILFPTRLQQNIKKIYKPTFITVVTY